MDSMRIFEKQGIRLRPMIPEDIDILTLWDAYEHVKAAAPNDIVDWQEEFEIQSPWFATYMAELGGEPFGCVRIIDPYLEESQYWGKTEPNQRAIDIWIGPEEKLGQGYGTIMMELALEMCFDDPDVIRVIIDPLKSNSRARQFYERIGYEYVEDRWFEDDECAIYEYTREKWEQSTFSRSEF